MTIRKHIVGMEAWVAGNLDWSFGTRRYFGKDHLRVRETLVVDLYPRNYAQL